MWGGASRGRGLTINFWLLAEQEHTATATEEADPCGMTTRKAKAKAKAKAEAESEAGRGKGEYTGLSTALRSR